MVDVLPEWTVRGVKSSECVERKDGSESDREENGRLWTPLKPKQMQKRNSQNTQSKTCFKYITWNKAMKLYADDSPLYTWKRQRTCMLSSSWTTCKTNGRHFEDRRLKQSQCSAHKHYQVSLHACGWKNTQTTDPSGGSRLEIHIGLLWV